ncbi:hypothetical protein [Cupriavidus necator]
MTLDERRAAFNHATGKASNLGHPVTITVKDAEGKPVVRTMQQDEFIVYCTGFSI